MIPSQFFQRLKRTGEPRQEDQEETVMKLYQQLDRLQSNSSSQQQVIEDMKKKVSDLEQKNKILEQIKEKGGIQQKKVDGVQKLVGQSGKFAQLLEQQNQEISNQDQVLIQSPQDQFKNKVKSVEQIANQVKNVKQTKQQNIQQNVQQKNLNVKATPQLQQQVQGQVQFQQNVQQQVLQSPFQQFQQQQQQINQNQNQQQNQIQQQQFDNPFMPIQPKQIQNNLSKFIHSQQPQANNQNQNQSSGLSINQLQTSAQKIQLKSIIPMQNIAQKTKIPSTFTKQIQGTDLVQSEDEDGIPVFKAKLELGVQAGKQLLKMKVQ